MAGYLLTKKSNTPLLTGSIVHFHKRPAYIKHMDERSGFIYIVTMDERAEHLRAFPKDIGAKWYL